MKQLLYNFYFCGACFKRLFKQVKSANKIVETQNLYLHGGALLKSCFFKKKDKTDLRVSETKSLYYRIEICTFIKKDFDKGALQ